VDGSKAIRPEKTMMSPDPGRPSVDRSSGGFVPYKDQPERHVIISVGPPPATAPPAGTWAREAARPPRAVPAANQPCPDCAKALAKFRNDEFAPGRDEGGGNGASFVGRCSDGAYIYAVTNLSNKTVARR